MIQSERKLIAQDVESYLRSHQHKSMLRFITCGSVDDGKSTLIGRLLYESHLVFEDHLAALEVDSRKLGTQGGDLDLALLVDGLAAEREQGITIDVAYRFFNTQNRKFIVADCPGHEQYTRNMVTGASTADLAVILIDARRGVLTQSRRHSYLVSLVGVRRIVVAVNKLDLVDYDQATFDAIDSDYRLFANQLGLDDITSIPISALRGDNVTHASTKTPWYQGPTLLSHLEEVELDGNLSSGPFRMPVQWVNRPNLDFRGYSGLVVGGQVKVGDPVQVLPAGTRSNISRIVTFDGDLESASADQAVTVVLDDEIDVSRGDLICSQNDPAGVADQFEARIIWMHDEPMIPGRPYLAKVGARTVTMRISPPKWKVNVNTLEHVAAKALELNEIGVCSLTTDQPVAFDPSDVNRDTATFVLIDRMTNATLGMALISFALRRSQNVHWQSIDVTPEARSALKGHRPAVIWLTGLSGAGKSTIANRTEQLLHSLGVHTFLLDGDNIRQGLNHDLGFTEADRIENIRRVAEVARLMTDAGLAVICSFISPFRADRLMAREVIGDDRFCEVFVDAPLAVAEKRDPKGLYRKARRGELVHFTGVDSPYEAPDNPEVRIDTTKLAPPEAAQMLIERLRALGAIHPVPTA